MVCRLFTFFWTPFPSSSSREISGLPSDGQSNSYYGTLGELSLEEQKSLQRTHGEYNHRRDDMCMATYCSSRCLAMLVVWTFHLTCPTWSVVMLTDVWLSGIGRVHACMNRSKRTMMSVSMPNGIGMKSQECWQLDGTMSWNYGIKIFVSSLPVSMWTLDVCRCVFCKLFLYLSMYQSVQWKPPHSIDPAENDQIGIDISLELH